MKHILEFTLPEEQDNLDMHMLGPSSHMVIIDMQEFLRCKVKYEELSDIEYKIIEECRNKLIELIEENGVKL